MGWKKYRKLIGPIIVAVYAIGRAFGVEAYVVEADAIVQVTNLFDALIPILGIFLTYTLPNVSPDKAKDAAKDAAKDTAE